MNTLFSDLEDETGISAFEFTMQRESIFGDGHEFDPNVSLDPEVHRTNRLARVLHNYDKESYQNGVKKMQAKIEKLKAGIQEYKEKNEIGDLRLQKLRRNNKKSSKLYKEMEAEMRADPRWLKCYNDILAEKEKEKKTEEERKKRKAPVLGLRC